MSGKGSGRRPQAEDEAIVQANWARIFGNKEGRTEAADNQPAAQLAPDEGRSISDGK